MGTAARVSGIRCVGSRLFADLGSGIVGVMGACLAISVGAPRLNAADSDGKKPSRQTVAQGRVLFEREWQPSDSRTHGGDGLGPVYNDSSCVACHNQGGTGGAGSAGKNVDIITAAANGPEQLDQQVVSVRQDRGFLNKALGSLLGLDAPAPAPAPNRPAAGGKAAKPARRKVDTTELVKAHPGFRTSRSVVLHRFGTDANYERWRQTFVGFQGANIFPTNTTGNAELMATQLAVNFDSVNAQTQIGPFFITRSQRNPTSLFGAGLIDSIAESDIEAAAKVKYPGFPEIAGRVSRMKDKRIGRFGWKSQTASLSDFVLTACAVELGLEVPAHHQGGSPQQPDAKSTGLDLDAQECESLVAYVSDLPRPAERKPESAREAKEVEAGRGLFAKVGCANCHAPKLGKVENIYSDLLLHDLGPALGDVGQYGVFDPSSSEEEVVDDPATVADASGVNLPVVQRATQSLRCSATNSAAWNGRRGIHRTGREPRMMRRPGHDGRVATSGVVSVRAGYAGDQATHERAGLAVRVAHSSVVGLPRFGALPARRARQNARPGDCLSWRRGGRYHPAILQAYRQGTPAARGIHEVADGAGSRGAGGEREVNRRETFGPGQGGVGTTRRRLDGGHGSGSRDSAAQRGPRPPAIGTDDDWL